MPYQKHELFRLNHKDSYKVWRYISIPALISILDRKQIHFSRSDKLGDPYEGYLGLKAIKKWGNIFSKIPPEKRGSGFNTMRKMPGQQREKIFVSCWHGNSYESMAMWKLYAISGEGVAISTTLGQLRDCFTSTKSEIYLGEVTYIDHSEKEIDWSNVLRPFVYKNKCYSYEKEVRALIWKPDLITEEVDRSESGIYVPVLLDKLIKNIYVSPLAPSWLEEIIKSICIKYEMSPKVVRQSSIMSPLTYF